MMSFDPYEFDRGISPQGQSMTLSEYTARTFLWMVLGLMVTFGVAVSAWLTGTIEMIYQFHLLILIATLILSVTIASRIERMSVGAAIGMFVAYSAMFGLIVSIYLVIFGVGMAMFCFLATALYFAVLAAYGYFTKRDLTGAGPILFSSLILLIVVTLLTSFIPSFSHMDQLVCLLGIAIFLGYVSYDAQKIKAYYQTYAGYPEMLEKASIFSALQLYLDFLNLFLYLLRFMGNRKR
jgi:FtsH-binding integral membrane protein